MVIDDGLFEMSIPLDVRRIRLLSQVVRDKSFTAAAASLGVSQPSLSKNIRALEISLGVKLLERGRFGALPTAFALALVRHADAIDAELRLAQSEISALKSARTGALCIGCGPTEASRLLPLALAALRKHSPNIKITVLHGLNEALMPMVKHGEVDFALSSIPARCTDSDLKQLPLHFDQGVIVSRAGHPLARQRKAITTAQLTSYDWILARQQELERGAFNDIFTQANASPPTPIIETTSTTLMKSVVMQSDCLTFLPRELVHWETRAKQLQILPLASLDWKRIVGITRRARSSSSPAQDSLIAELRKVTISLD